MTSIISSKFYSCLDAFKHVYTHTHTHTLTEIFSLLRQQTEALYWLSACFGRVQQPKRTVIAHNWDENVLNLLLIISQTNEKHCRFDTIRWTAV